jgi:hypothetical protein
LAVSGRNSFATKFHDRIVTAVVLDSIAGQATSRLVIAGDTARNPAAGLVETAAARVQEQAGAPPRHSSGFTQLLDLAFPFTLYEQGPVLERGVGALTLTTASDQHPSTFSDTPGRLNGGRLAQIGRSTQELLRALDQGAELVQGTSSYVYLGARVIRGWAIELVLIAALLPFLISTIDLFARCRRRRLPIAPALRSYRSRLAFWLWLGARLRALRPARRLARRRGTSARTAESGRAALALVRVVGPRRARRRRLGDRPLPTCSTRAGGIDDELAGHTPRCWHWALSA